MACRLLFSPPTTMMERLNTTAAIAARAGNSPNFVFHTPSVSTSLLATPMVAWSGVATPDWWGRHCSPPRSGTEGAEDRLG